MPARDGESLPAFLTVEAETRKYRMVRRCHSPNPLFSGCFLILEQLRYFLFLPFCWSLVRFCADLFSRGDARQRSDFIPLTNLN
jgi:hypothetical protein